MNFLSFSFLTCKFLYYLIELLRRPMGYLKWVSDSAWHMVGSQSLLRITTIITSTITTITIITPHHHHHRQQHHYHHPHFQWKRGLGKKFCLNPQPCPWNSHPPFEDQLDTTLQELPFLQSPASVFPQPLYLISQHLGLGLLTAVECGGPGRRRVLVRSCAEDALGRGHCRPGGRPASIRGVLIRRALRIEDKVAKSSQ